MIFSQACNAGSYRTANAKMELCENLGKLSARYFEFSSEEKPRKLALLENLGVDLVSIIEESGSRPTALSAYRFTYASCMDLESISNSH